MLTAIAALALFSQGEAPAQNVNAAELVSKMLAYYSDAQTMTGTIVMSAKAGNDVVTVTTNLQYEKPAKLYIRQQKNQGDRRAWVTVSDGKIFAYNVPQNLSIDPNKRLVERVKVGDVSLDYKQIYAASSPGLGDRSAPLDIAISRLEDLRFLRDQWKTVEYRGETEYDGVRVHVVMGEWRAYGNAPVQGTYRMYITSAGDLRQFAKTETLGDGVATAIPITTTWDVKLVKNGKVDPSLFERVR